MTKESLDTYYDELGTTLGEALIAPTKIYVKALRALKMQGLRSTHAAISQAAVSMRMYLVC